MVYSSLSLCSPSSTVKELNLVRKSDDHNSCLRWWELISMRDRCWWTDEWWWSRRVNLQISKQLLVNKSDQWKDGWMDKLDGSRSEWLIELMMKWMNACCSMHGDRRNVQLTKESWTIDRSNERHDRRQRHARPTATLSVVVLCGFRTRFTSSRLAPDWVDGIGHKLVIAAKARTTSKMSFVTTVQSIGIASYANQWKSAERRCVHWHTSERFQLVQLCARC